jgi:uncharacterized membrane-anchored protein
VMLQFLILVGMLLGHTVPYIGARTVLLHVQPRDPRDLFRGDYVTLSYDISRGLVGRAHPGGPVYVSLVAGGDGRHYRADAFLDAPPASGLFIRGTVRGGGWVDYGIETYYVQEGTGHDYETAVRIGRLWAEVALDRNGNPQLKRLVIE